MFTGIVEQIGTIVAREPRGIVITVDVGRRSKGCQGFGICSITIEVPLSLRSVPSAAVKVAIHTSPSACSRG